MARKKTHFIEIGPKRGSDRNKLMTGAGTRVKIDGKPFRFVKSIRVDARAAGLVITTVELYSTVKFRGNTIIEQTKVTSDKPFASVIGQLVKLPARTRAFIQNLRKK